MSESSQNLFLHIQIASKHYLKKKLLDCWSKLSPCYAVNKLQNWNFALQEVGVVIQVPNVVNAIRLD